MIETWPVTNLGALGEFRNGVNFSRDQEGHGIPVLKVKDFGSKVFAPREGLDELALSVSELSQGQLLQDGDTVIIRSNGNSVLVGRSVFFRDSGQPTTFSGFCIRFRPDTNLVDPMFAAYFLRSPLVRQRFSAFGSGTGIQNLTQEILSGLPLHLPSNAEQRAIAHILGTLDDKIELNRRTNETLEAIARAIFKSWFVDFNPVRAKAEGRQPSGMDAATAALFPDSFQDSALGKIPKGWRVGKLAEIASLTRESMNPSVFPTEVFQHYSIPAFDEDRWPKQELGGQIKSNKFLVPQDAVLLSKLNPRFPRVWLPFISNGGCPIASTEFLVALPRNSFSREYLYGLFTSESFFDVFETLVTGTSSSHQRVKSDFLLAMETIIPSHRCIDCFSRIVVPLYATVANNLSESRTLSAIRDALLPKLISGEIRVPHQEAL